MKASFFLLALSGLGALASPMTPRSSKGAYSLPAGSEDGFYVGTINDDGSATWEYLGKAEGHAAAANGTNETSAVAGRASSAGLLADRASQGVTCGSTWLGADAAFAGQYFINMCGSGLPFSKIISYQYETAVAYGCNYGNGQTCYGSQVGPFFADIEDDCGDTDGWYSIPSWKASYGIAFNRESYC